MVKNGIAIYIALVQVAFIIIPVTRELSSTLILQNQIEVRLADI